MLVKTTTAPTVTPAPRAGEAGAQSPVPLPDLSVVAPLYGNAATLRELVARIAAALESVDWELILVDDASPDGAGELALEIAAGEPRVGGRGARPKRRPKRGAAGRCLARFRPQDRLHRRRPAGSAGDSTGAARRRPRRRPPFGIRRGAYQSWPRRLSSKIFKTLRSRLAGVPPGAGLLLLADGELLRSVARAAPRPCRFIPLLGARRPNMAAIPVERAVRPHGVSAYRGLARWKIGLAELFAALRLRCGLAAGPPAPGRAFHAPGPAASF